MNTLTARAQNSIWLLLIGLVILLVACQSSLPSQQASTTNAPTIEQTILQNERDIAGAWVKHDTSVVERLFADDFREIITSGRIISKADMVAQAGRTSVVKMDTFDPSVRVISPDLAIYTARIVSSGTHAETGEPFTNNMHLFAVWALRNGKWQIVAGQTAPAKPPG